MNISQLYETTIVDTDSGLDAHCVILPARSLQLPTEENESILEALGLKFKGRIPPGQLQLFIHWLVSTGFVEEVSEGWAISLQKKETPTREQLAFAEYLVCARTIPFENSPLSPESLGNIATSGVAVGAFVGYVLAGHTPLLFLAVPAGMVLCGAAAGVGKALEEGLRERLLTILSSSKHPKK